MNKYCIIDLETTVIKSFNKVANPLDPRNKVIVFAKKVPEKDPELFYNQKGLPKRLPKSIFSEKTPLLVGQNIKFDLLYLWKDPALRQWVKEGGAVWDTMTVEYLLQGQQRMPYNLDALAAKYGGTIKDDRLSAMYKKGIGSDQIDKDILLPYAANDVTNTEIVYLAQLKLVKQKGMLPLVTNYMKHYLAIVEMEFNGLYVDKPELVKRAEDLNNEIDQLVIDIRHRVESGKWPTEDIEFDVSSNDHISAYFFGGQLPTIKDIPQLVDGEPYLYKSGAKKGQVKTRKEKVLIPIEGRLTPKDEWQGKKEGVYSVDNKTLKCLQEDKSVADIIGNLLQYREKRKLLSTYYHNIEYNCKGGIKKETGFLPLIHPHSKCIHPEFRTNLTRTGRLASRNPNGQNIPPDVREVLTSRYGENGVLVAIDYGQLEVVIQAWITQCPQMMQDIRDGVDFHCKRLAYAEDLPYDEVVKRCSESPEWAEKRKKAKVISFQKAYGAQPESIAKTTGLDVEIVKAIFAKEDAEYPEVGQFYDLVMQDVQDTTIPTQDLVLIRNGKGKMAEWKKQEGEHQRVGFYQSPLGKMYSFLQKAVRTKRGDVFRYFSVPDIQDYPIQGSAADLVATQVGLVFDYIFDQPDIKMVCEVHDELVLDMTRESIDLHLPKICAILKNVDESFKKNYGVSFNVPLGIDVGIGKSWRGAKDNELGDLYNG